MATDESEIIHGIFQIFAKLVDIGEDVQTIRRAVEEDDDGEADEEG